MYPVRQNVEQCQELLSRIKGGIIMKNKSQSQSAPDQAGNVNSPVKPFCYKYRHHSMWGGTMLLDEPTYDGQEAIETIPLYRLPEGHCIVPIEPTVVMREAIQHFIPHMSFIKTRQFYKAMLAASPTNVPPPEISTDAVEAAGRCTACGEELI